MLRTALVMGFFLTATAANADWQYVKWGMSGAQVVAASKGELRPSSGDGGKRIMCLFNDLEEMAFAPNKQVGPYTFDMIVCGKDGKVSSVSLRSGSQSNSFNSLHTELLAKYGKPIEERGRGDMTVTSWQDTKSRNMVRLSRFMETGSVEYRTITSGSGL